MKNKNVLYNICATIINDNLNGIYSIIIEKDYEFYNLNKNDICLVKSNMIKKVEYKVWLKILSYIEFYCVSLLLYYSYYFIMIYCLLF